MCVCVAFTGGMVRAACWCLVVGSVVWGSLDQWADWLEVGRVDRGQVQLCLSLGRALVVAVAIVVALVVAMVVAVVAGCVALGHLSDVKRPTQNWHGLGESDCLIKTKHCDVC